MKAVSGAIKNSVSFKILSIFILILILLIPSSMVQSLIREREYRSRDVISEISSKWGRSQTLAGPVISIPYKKYFEDKNGEKTFSIRYMHLLPDDIHIKAELNPEIRYRGIYKAALYNGNIELSGSFPFPDYEKMNIPDENIIWESTSISIGISDMRGIKDQIGATFNESKIMMNPGVDTNDVISSGISSRIVIQKQSSKFPFKFMINLNGSQEINFVPVGKETNVSISSTWQDPSFSGEYLPVERSIGEDGFTARWKVLHLNRSFPQFWIGNQYQLAKSAFGVKLFIPVDIYQKSMRTAKYALMFIVFTFMAFFISEVMNRFRVHPIQYLLIGFSIIIFYALLISISEHLNFGGAYFISSISIVGLITGYAGSILKNTKMAVMVGGVMVVLYSYLYTLLQLKDYALLMGSIGLFVVLGLIMYMTRKIDWYNFRFGDHSEQKAV
ncbi:MAG: cell envelope integrity protein CreD [Desulfobacterales bacterium]|nr:cell envelope integrity protein CreD [Desulfobacterales bacterium]